MQLQIVDQSGGGQLNYDDLSALGWNRIEEHPHLNGDFPGNAVSGVGCY